MEDIDIFNKELLKHPKFFSYLKKNNQLENFKNIFHNFYNSKKTIEANFLMIVKKYLLDFRYYEDNELTDLLYKVEHNKNDYVVPDYLKSFNFKFINNIDNIEDLIKYNDSLFLLNKEKDNFINTLGIENIKKLEEETGFFSYKTNNWNFKFSIFNAISMYFSRYYSKTKDYVDFKNGALAYDDFLNEFAKFLELIRKNNFYLNVPYDFINGDFRKKHKEIFMDKKAPEDLKDLFYRNKIDIDLIIRHEEYIPYLLDKNLSNIINDNLSFIVPNEYDKEGKVISFKHMDFLKEYSSRYGNQKLLDLFTKYKNIISSIVIIDINNSIDNKEDIDNLIKEAIYQEIIKRDIDYRYLANVEEFSSLYPEIFINLDNINTLSKEEKETIITNFYNKNLRFEDVRKYKELKEILKNKKLKLFLSKNDYYNDFEYLENLDNKYILELLSIYGKYITGTMKILNKEINLTNFDKTEKSFEKLKKKLEDIIARECLLGNISYSPKDAPLFLKQDYPELFLDEDAPEDLKKFFYNMKDKTNKYPMSFLELSNHKNLWLKYLKNKSIVTSLLRSTHCEEDLLHYIELFGEEKAIKLGINKPKTVEAVLENHKVDLMKKWYDKTGSKFVPDIVVMENFKLEEIDKFLLSGKYWSKLMKIKNFTYANEYKEAMLKLAYSFGVFDQDEKGFKEVYELLTNIPKKIDSEQSYILKNLDMLINNYTKKETYFSKYNYQEAVTNMINDLRYNLYKTSSDDISLLVLIENLYKENVPINLSQDIFTELYRINEDKNYSLSINEDIYPKTKASIRSILEKYDGLNLVSPDIAHKLFGGFKLKYDSKFRDFLLKNMNEILEKPGYGRFVSGIQKQFDEIRIANSNRFLTLDLAIKYIQNNIYNSIDIGNEKVAEVSRIAGYSQEDFEILQKIYNYGKQRIFSSIPRIESKRGKYQYEMLRLDDPLAMTIGTLSNCCQELHNIAEMCMEHSMVDQNGRIFLVKDDIGNVVAQSWVWRNKDVICFDNIEIPNRAISREVKSEVERRKFTDEIYEVYKKASKELIKIDEGTYKKFLEDKIITQEEYETLRLKKVTVGSGYNDIAESLKANAILDKGTITRPLEFEASVELNHGLYTKDSNIQYVLEEQDSNNNFSGETYAIYKDNYIEYDDSNFKKIDLFSLERLELITKKNPLYLKTDIADMKDSNSPVTELAKNYKLNPKTTRVIINPNFAIIYDINDNIINIGDLLFNTKIEIDEEVDITDKVMMQINIAINQIKKDKEIDISSLDENQRKMYNSSLNLEEKKSIRGLVYERKRHK